jgi:hypothetical protein
MITVPPSRAAVPKLFILWSDVLHGTRDSDFACHRHSIMLWSVHNTSNNNNGNYNNYMNKSIY